MQQSSQAPRWPIGTDEFRPLRREGCVYVDKTRLIESFELDGSPAVLCLRPRRFGKSLALSMLQAFYGDDHSEHEDLFQGTWVRSSHYWRLAGSRAAIYLSLKDISAHSLEDFESGLQASIGQLLRPHMPRLVPHLSPTDLEDLQAIIEKRGTQLQLTSSLLRLTSGLATASGSPCYLFLDEYDAPLIRAQESGCFAEVASFYQLWLGPVLKGGRSYVHKAFLTGILQISQHGLSSGLNNLRVCGPLEDKYAAHFGFTQDEVEQLLSSVARGPELSSFHEWYNGYTIGTEALFNPWSILMALDSGEAPMSYWTFTGATGLLLWAIRHADPSELEALRVLIGGESIRRPLDRIRQPLEFESGKAPAAPLFTLMLNTGYLTGQRSKEDPQTVVLRVPNLEVRLSFRSILAPLFSPMGGDALSSLWRALSEGDAGQVQRWLSRFLLTSASAFDLTASTLENSYHLMVLGLCAALQDSYQIFSNGESGWGRFDILLQPRRPNQPGIVVEVKRAAAVADLASVAESALQQIRDREYDARLRQAGVHRILHYGVAFCGRDVEVKVAKQKGP
ncbi:MAG: AAA family ATPase [Chlamydiia bacterium]